MKVYHTPVLPHRAEVAPVVRASDGEGYRIEQGNARGAFSPTLAAAVHDWNQTLVAAFPGISDAAFSYWDADTLRRMGPALPQPPQPAPAAPEDEAAKSKLRELEAKLDRLPKSLQAMVYGMLAAVCVGPDGPLSLLDEDEPATTEYDEGCVNILLARGFAQRTPFGAVVACPKDWGNFSEQLHAALHAKNEKQVEALTSGRKGPFHEAPQG